MSLPITESLPDLLAVLARNQNAIFVAPPGAGKTTMVPLALLDAAWRGEGRIVMLEPRRLAARAAARRMATLLGEEVGGRVGFRTRLESAVCARTLIEVVTEGLLVRRLQADPGLEGVACVIFDEVHERALDADLALAFCLDIQRVLRPELRLVAMSATADGARLAGLMGAEIVQSVGRMFPVEERHATRELASPRDLPAAMAHAVRAALASETGDILAFLPGMGEIRRTEQALEGCGALVLKLHGDLPVAEQDRALSPAPGRRVVLASAIAETSLTVPGVRVVIDGGWRRAPVLDQATGLTRLATLRISRAAATQRAGRAGREAPGVAIRLWTQALHRGLAPFDTPAILAAELSGLVLDCAAWGAAPASLAFADAPPAGALAAAAALLAQLGALDDAGRITRLGQRMARLGAHPRLAAMMLSAQDAPAAALAANIASLLEERDPLGPMADSDIETRLALLRDGATHHPAADRAALARIRSAATQYRRRLRTDSPPAGDPGPLLACAFPDRIAQARGEPGSFRLSGGGSARLPPTDPLARAKLLVVAALEQKTAARIRLAARLDPACLPQTVQAAVRETVETGFDPVSGSVFARVRRRYGALLLEERVLPADPAQTATTTAAILAEALATRLSQLPWDEPARQFQARALLMRGLDPDFPDLSDAALAADTAQWLAPHLAGFSRLADMARLDMSAILRAMLSWAQAQALDRALPSHLTLPGGRAPIDYTQPVPVASARAQAFFGLSETPLLAGGRIPLALSLLSPAQRPVAVTRDLAGFWRGGWGEVRKEMRGRYPRHRWPEEPGKM